MNRFAAKLQRCSRLHSYHFNWVCPSSCYAVEILVFVIFFPPPREVKQLHGKGPICIVNVIGVSRGHGV